MKNIINKQQIIIGILLITTIICSYFYLKDIKAKSISQKEYRLIIPSKNLESIKLDNINITNKYTNQKITAALSDRTTTIASISDYPVNATNIIKIEFIYSNSSSKTIIIYQKGQKYFAEEPYNGIYKIKKDEYRKIENFKSNMLTNN